MQASYLTEYSPPDLSYGDLPEPKPTRTLLVLVRDQP